jgi:hypothetical protein
MSRSVKGARGKWFVLDPCFFALQRGLGKERRGYRSGIYVNGDEIAFANVHSRAPAQYLRTNLIAHPEALISAAERTRRLRAGHFLSWASRSKAKRNSGRDYHEEIDIDNWREFKETLSARARSIALDLFPVLRSSGGSPNGVAVRGSDFYLLLASTKCLQHETDVVRAIATSAMIIDAAWHLFACTYPWERGTQRRDDLHRAMTRHVGRQRCEYWTISALPPLRCDGTKCQAAHIKPYARGGTDRPWNGLWLCRAHHRATEGLLRGERNRADLKRVSVRFVGAR